jgi:hypothetical protein
MSKKMGFVSLFFLILLVLLSYSCGAQRTYQTTPPTEGLARYVVIEIPDFKSSLNYLPPDTFWVIPNEIAEKLMREQIFTGVSRSPVDISEGVVILEGTIVELTPKDWYEQAVRTVRVVAHVRFIDKAENRVIAEAKFEGSSKAGAVSGGVPFAYSRLVDEIVRYIKLNYTSP